MHLLCDLMTPHFHQYVCVNIASPGVPGKIEACNAQDENLIVDYAFLCGESPFLGDQDNVKINQFLFINGY